MTKHGFRFRPPGVAFGPELRWVLLRGFGPPDAEFKRALQPETTWALSTALDLGPRIGTRISSDRLRSELGTDTARKFLIASAAAEAQGMRLMRVAHEVAAAAAAAGVPIVFLKFAALCLSGAVTAGSRSAADLDVMVAPENLESFANALRSRGFTTSGVPDSDQHMAPFIDGTGVVVEVHRYVQGVRLSRRQGFATAGELAARDCLVSVPQLPGVCSMPSREVAAAYVVVHGVAHHGRKPQEYPLFRVVADLVDLGFASNNGETLLERITPWVEGEVSSEETRAVQNLCARLSVGDDELFVHDAQAGSAVLLLRHLIAGSTDSAYAESLQVSAFLGRVSHLPRLVAVMRAIWHALFLNRAQIDKIYGKQSSWVGYLRRQAIRPFNLLGQATHSVAQRFLPLSRR